MAKITVQQISRRAKEIRKAHPGKQWIACIKEASKQLKEGKLAKKAGARKKVGAAKTKKAYRQTGTSSKKRDEERHAKAPGKQLVRHGSGKAHYYTERRKNRSDVPGKLTGGIGSAMSQYQFNILSRIKNNTYYQELSRKNIDRFTALMKGTKGAEKLAYKRQIQAEKKNIATLRKDTAMLKRLLR